MDTGFTENDTKPRTGYSATSGSHYGLPASHSTNRVAESSDDGDGDLAQISSRCVFNNICTQTFLVSVAKVQSYSHFYFFFFLADFLNFVH